MAPVASFGIRYRFWILLSLYWIGFAFYPLDRTDLVQVAARLIANGPPEQLARILYGLIALPVLAGAWLRTWAVACAPPGGPYRVFTHPADAGTAVLVLGFGLTLNRPGFLFLAIAVAVFMRLTSARVPLAGGYGWRDALLREGYLSIAAAAWIAFALEPREAMLYAVLGGALLLRGLAQFCLRPA